MDNNIQTNNQGQQPVQQPTPQYIIVKQQSNTIGMAGFVMTLVALFLALFPFLQIVDIVMIPLAFICCIIGLFKKPRTWAVIGLLLHLIMFGVFTACTAGVLAGIHSAAGA